MRLATTTADLTRSLENPADLVEPFDGTGFRYLDLNLYRCVYPGSPILDERWEQWTQQVADAAETRNLRFCQAHGPDGNPFATGDAFDAFLKATLRSIEICGKLGIPAVVMHSKDIGGYPSRDYREQNLKRNREFFAQLFPTLEKTGVQVLVENSCDRHAPTKENSRHFPSTAAELLELADYLDHPLIHVCWDTGHANVQGVDQYRSIVELGPRLRGLHINDNYGDMDSHVAPFQGTTNLDAVMQGLVDSRYDGYFTFEASNILRNGAVWPNFRREWHLQGEKVTRLMDVPLDLKRQAVALLYQIGRHMLTEYACFEE